MKKTTLEVGGVIAMMDFLAAWTCRPWSRTRETAS